MHGALCSRRGTRGYSATPDGDANNLKKRGMVDGGRRRGSRQSAVKLTVLNRKLLDAIFGSQRTVAPPLPTAGDFVASLPRRLHSTEIFTFLSRHHPYPIDERKAIHREGAAIL